MIDPTRSGRGSFPPSQHLQRQRHGLDRARAEHAARISCALTSRKKTNPPANAAAVMWPRMRPKLEDLLRADGHERMRDPVGTAIAAMKRRKNVSSASNRRVPADAP